MSTRCNIIIKEKEKSVKFYHHCDGYLEGVGKELQIFIKEFLSEEDDISASELATFILDQDEGYEFVNHLAGDAEYVYVIEIINDKIIFNAYVRENWNEDNYQKWPIVLNKTYEK